MDNFKSNDGLIELFNANCSNVMYEISKAPVIFIDPPFDKWSEVPFFHNKTKVCFTNFQNRNYIEKVYGKPRFEIIWHFKDGRWVSHKLPRITHESILIYGQTGESYVGERNENMKPQKKGSGCVGRDKMPERVYKPRKRKALNSVIEYPRNVSNPMGCWGKPINLMVDILAWMDTTHVADPFAGSCSLAIAAKKLGVKYTGCEIDTDTYNKSVERLINEGS